jgi:uncharacterized Zn-binding protein involved in type VI secretion
MPLVALNTISTGGGGALNVYDTLTDVVIENRFVAVKGTYVTGHAAAPHNAASNPRVSQGSKNVFAGPSEKAVARVGDLVTCGHPVVDGATTVYCGG